MSIYAHFLAQPLPFWQGMLLYAFLAIVVLLLAGFGFYFFLRALGGGLARRQKSWESLAGKLGLTVDRDSNATYRRFTGERDGLLIQVDHFAANPRILPRGRFRADNCAEVKVLHSEPFDYEIDLAKREVLYEKVAAYFDSQETVLGDEELDQIFEITCSNATALLDLLCIKLPDIESSSLADGLQKAARTHLRVQFTDRWVCLGRQTDFADADQIRPIIENALKLSHLISSAQKLVRK